MQATLISNPSYFSKEIDVGEYFILCCFCPSTTPFMVFSVTYTICEEPKLDA